RLDWEVIGSVNFHCRWMVGPRVPMLGPHHRVLARQVVEQPSEDSMSGASEDAAQGGAGEGEALTSGEPVVAGHQVPPVMQRWMGSPAGVLMTVLVAAGPMDEKGRSSCL